ncbi:TetR family transcriptional regulator [Thalassospira indica]|uniref:TetR/AcrR family transcriptional regulator n=1 Tax=Thalassospira indica TaxID=1891279 RepID=A0ABM6Y495_9PROT|nr:TetR family transcriptional regulator [Thalassospira indica]AXO16830.1 TetR/AcrR family transcriptional regulator [Thalassospira indica]OAZ11509.1 transcriptional regulator [Thalassospira profundimaris]
MEQDNLVRARSHEQKLKRRADILEAARKLYLVGDGTLPSAAEVARKANLAKGTLYLYFSSKEALFLEVLRHFQKEWFENNLDVIDQEALRRPEERDSTRVARQFVQYLVKNDKFLHLASLSQGVLESGSDDEMVINQRRFVASMVKRTADALAELYEITPDAASKLMRSSYALVLGLWQMSQLPDRVIKLMEQNALNNLIIDFEEAAKEAVVSYWQVSAPGMKCREMMRKAAEGNC